MKKLLLLSFTIIAVLLVSCNQKKSQTSQKPNIVFIYVDDLGYGDVGCYGAKLVNTPNVDELAKNGLQFMDAHCTSSMCTPSRFSLLTGSYAFRNNAAILPGDAPLIINTEQETLPDMLKKAGYTTGVIGKWHLGLGNGKPNWNGDIKPGPLEIGFDYSFLIPATPDRVPTVFVENHKVANLDPSDPITVNYDKRIGNDPIGLEDEELLTMKADSQHSGTIVNGISRIGFMSGGHKAYWKDEEFPNVLTAKAKDFINQNKNQPFFLYFALPDIHVPRSPNKKFVGATTLGPRGDDIAQMDWVTGQIMKTLKDLNLDKNTLVIFSSDNGPVLDDGYADDAKIKVGTHKPAGDFKGGKYSAYEAGTRVPTIAYWPGIIKPGKSNALISQVDFFASLANLVGLNISDKSVAPDSFDMLPVLLGDAKNGRDELVEESFTLCLRSGDWKYIAPQTKSTPGWLANKDVASGLQIAPQLYNLKSDPGEKNNLASQYPDKVKELSARLTQIINAPTRVFK
jgi:arylsulfatase A-like enzyme